MEKREEAGAKRCRGKSGEADEADGVGIGSDKAWCRWMAVRCAWVRRQ